MKFRSVAVLLSLFAGVALVLSIGCTNRKYTLHIDPSLQNQKIVASTIAVFPIKDMRYQPPSSCMGPQGKPSDKETYQAAWNGKLKSSLVTRFPAQKWVFIDEGQDAGVDIDAVIDLSAKSARATTINQLESDRILYEPLGKNTQMETYLRNLQNTTGAQYALVFVEPVLSGEIVTTYHTGPYGGSASSTTYYTGDVQVLVWECSSGRVLFSSGGWSKNSSPCFMITPQDMAIDGVNGKFQRTLSKIIALLMEYDAAKRFAGAN